MRLSQTGLDAPIAIATVSRKGIIVNIEKKYILTYPNKKFLRIDSDSGYPYEAEDSPNIWHSEGEAEKYADMFPKENLEVWEMEYNLKDPGITEEIEVYVDLVDFMYEIGMGNAPGPHKIYNSIQEIKEKQPCVEECGIVRAKLVKLETVQAPNYVKLKKGSE